MLIIYRFTKRLAKEKKKKFGDGVLRRVSDFNPDLNASLIGTAAARLQSNVYIVRFTFMKDVVDFKKGDYGACFIASAIKPHSFF